MLRPFPHQTPTTYGKLGNAVGTKVLDIGHILRLPANPAVTERPAIAVAFRGRRIGGEAFIGA